MGFRNKKNNKKEENLLKGLLLNSMPLTLAKSK
jgi:hypothetical protein